MGLFLRCSFGLGGLGSLGDALYRLFQSGKRLKKERERVKNKDRDREEREMETEWKWKKNK